MDERLEQCNHAITVSVIVPVYNVSAYIERCVRSVMAQTYTDIECIIVDDVSPDDSIAKCERLIADYEGSIRFSILHHEKNRGLSAARNTGTDAAIGEYIYYLDSDDEITSDCILTLMQIAQQDSTIEIVQGNIEKRPHDAGTYEYDLRKLHLPTAFTNNSDIRQWYFQLDVIKPGNAWNKLIRKDFLTNNGISFKEGIIHEDDLWMFYIVKYLSHIYFEYEVTYVHYITDNSIMTSPNRNLSLWSRGQIFMDVFEHLTLTDDNREVRYYVITFCRLYRQFSKSMRNELHDVYRSAMHSLLMKRQWILFLKLLLTHLLRGRMRRLWDSL